MNWEDLIRRSPTRCIEFRIVQRFPPWNMMSLYNSQWLRMCSVDFHAWLVYEFWSCHQNLTMKLKTFNFYIFGTKRLPTVNIILSSIKGASRLQPMNVFFRAWMIYGRVPWDRCKVLQSFDTVLMHNDDHVSGSLQVATELETMAYNYYMRLPMNHESTDGMKKWPAKWRQLNGNDWKNILEGKCADMEKTGIQGMRPLRLINSSPSANLLTTHGVLCMKSSCIAFHSILRNFIG